jgi:hypothetical protein
MATLVDLTNQMNAFGDAIGAASGQTSILHRQTGELVQMTERIAEARGRLTLEAPVYQPPTIDSGRGISLLTGYRPGVRVGPTFLNYATTFLGFGASGYESANSRVSGGPYG